MWPGGRPILRKNAEAYTWEIESKVLAKSTGTKSPLSIVLHDACTSNKLMLIGPLTTHVPARPSNKLPSLNHVAPVGCPRWCQARRDYSTLGCTRLVLVLGRRDWRYWRGTSDSNQQSSESSSSKSDSRSSWARLGALRPVDWPARGRCPISIPKDTKILRYFSTMCGR